MTEFEVGDRVIVNYPNYDPLIGTVRGELERPGFDYEVRYDEGSLTELDTVQKKYMSRYGCGKKNHEPVYHDKREEYVCPWCEPL